MFALVKLWIVQGFVTFVVKLLTFILHSKWPTRELILFSAIRLDGQPFYAMDGKPFCEACYMNTLEKCSVCSKAITDRVGVSRNVFSMLEFITLVSVSFLFCSKTELISSGGRWMCDLKELDSFCDVHSGFICVCTGASSNRETLSSRLLCLRCLRQITGWHSFHSGRNESNSLHWRLPQVSIVGIRTKLDKVKSRINDRNRLTSFDPQEICTPLLCLQPTHHAKSRTRRNRENCGHGPELPR